MYCRVYVDVFLSECVFDAEQNLYFIDHIYKVAYRFCKLNDLELFNSILAFYIYFTRLCNSMYDRRNEVRQT